MPLKNILVHLDQTPQSIARFDLALGLAKNHQSRLTAFFASSSPHFSQAGEKPLREKTWAVCAEKAAAARIPLTWSEPDEREALLPLTTRIIHQAAYADLCIVGKPGNPTALPRDFTERLVLSSGHPVVSVPVSGSFSSLGRRVMIAWKAGRASARAVSDALPFLASADEVILISFSTTPEERTENDRTLKKMADYLACHEVRAKIENRTITDISLVDALLNRAAEEGTDLLVCGGMVASQPGPLAGQLLHEMTVPVLMSN